MNDLNPVRSPLDTVLAFNEAWNAHDLEAVLELVAPDCIFESARPAPGTAQVVGRDALRSAWASSFATPGGVFDFEDIIVAGERIVQLWRYGLGADAVRGVDVLRVESGLIAEKLGYIKVM